MFLSEVNADDDGGGDEEMAASEVLCLYEEADGVSSLAGCASVVTIQRS